MAYFPREDSYLLSGAIEKWLKGKDKKIKILDMGSGSGIQAETCIKKGFKEVEAADIEQEVIDFLKRKKIKARQSNLFSKIKGKFDLVVFNPPYLPEDKYDKEKDTTGGKKGHETIVRFLKQAKAHLTKGGTILLLYSSLSNPKEIFNTLKKLKYTFKQVAQQKDFFEELFVIELNLENSS
jgi:release factor glutamine methyltransferase